MASTELAISMSSRAAASGLENSLSEAYFTRAMLGINVSAVSIATFRIVVPVGNSILLATDIESGDAPALCERSVA